MDNRWMLQESPGILPALPGYNPILGVKSPKGYTAEYYGDDVLYIGYQGKIVAMIFDRPELLVKSIDSYGEKGEEFITWLMNEIKKIEGKWPIETYAGRHMQSV
jgi:hypothetical protein